MKTSIIVSKLNLSDLKFFVCTIEVGNWLVAITKISDVCSLPVRQHVYQWLPWNQYFSEVSFM